MTSGSLVLVDGWNHYLAVQQCFGYAAAVLFPIDRLAAHLTAQTEAEKVADAAVVMAIPRRDKPAEEADYWAWRKRLNKLKNHGVQHESARFKDQTLTCSGCEQTLSRAMVCGACGKTNRLAGRRKEKGADIKLAALALDGAWLQSYSTLILLSQDEDFGPLIRKIKEVHRRQGRRYDLYSAYPVCSRPGHNHRPVPSAKPLEITAEDYSALAARPLQDPRTAG